jgi:hypothetical protein
MKIEDVLVSKARAGELAHFYLLETALNEDDASVALMEFCHTVIKRYFHEVEKQTHPLNNLMDHPDILVISGVEDKKDYTVEDAALMEKFFSWKPVQGKRKFVVIPEAHRITNVLANKWLKVLEEPPVPATIFLLNPRRIKLLPTIQSRALALRLPRERSGHDSTEWNEFLAEVKNLGLADFLETFSRGERPLSFWLEELLYWETERTAQLEGKTSLEKTLKTLKEMDIFNQPAATKWTFLYYHLKDHVLPQLTR